MTTTQNFAVTGMTCAHCVGAVTEEVSALPGVTAVTIELNPAGASRLTTAAATPLTDQQVAAALDEAGDYQLADRP